MATGEEVLDLPMTTNDAEAKTVRDYLKALLTTLWTEEEGFSGKRPFGNSGWAYELYRPLFAAGLASEDDLVAANELIFDAIEAL